MIFLTNHGEHGEAQRKAPIHGAMRFLLLALLALPAPSRAQNPAPTPEYRAFQHPERVSIAGYSGDAMEPFLTHDGRYLLFNNRNDPSVNTNLHYAERIDDLHFAYRGEIQGVNTDALEGVPSVSCDGTLYFVSTRSYGKTFSTIYRAHFAKGVATNVELVPGISRRPPGWVNFDAEISADGETLYSVDSQFKNGMPATADIFIAQKRGDVFERTSDSDEVLKLVNTNALEYAPAISSDGLELFFTRVEKITATAEPRIWRAARKSIHDPFGEPQLVSAITGFAEGPNPFAGWIVVVLPRARGREVCDYAIDAPRGG